MLRTALFASALALLLAPRGGAQFITGGGPASSEPLPGPRLAPYFSSLTWPDEARPYAVPVAAPSRGRTLLAYTGVGLLVGAVTGVLVGPLVTTPGCLALKKDVENQGSCLDALFLRPDKRVGPTLLFGGVGAAVGTVVGLFAKSGP